VQLKRILVAVKPWQRGLPLAASHARQLAKLANAQLQLVGTVFDARAAARSDRGEPAARGARDRALEAARVGLERLAGSLRDWGANVTTSVVWGVPAYEGILATAHEWRADLVVFGIHEHGTLHTRLTDTDWQLMRRVECPLLLVKRPSFDGYRTIVAAVDPLHAHDEPYGLDRAVLDAGRSIAHACDSTLRAVYAYPGAAAFDLASAVETSPGVFYGAENVAALHRRAVNELAEQFGVAAGEVDLVAGAAPEGIIDTVTKRRAELVVVGAPRRGGALAATLGSTAEHVVTAATCDVLVVPAPVADADRDPDERRPRSAL
jgi:nucleotide-binding universal stress UspA family protein